MYILLKSFVLHSISCGLAWAWARALQTQFHLYQSNRWKLWSCVCVCGIDSAIHSYHMRWIKSELGARASNDDINSCISCRVNDYKSDIEWQNEKKERNGTKKNMKWLVTTNERMWRIVSAATRRIWTILIKFIKQFTVSLALCIPRPLSPARSCSPNSIRLQAHCCASAQNAISSMTAFSDFSHISFGFCGWHNTI